ncbi:flagellar biosynthetic protein FliR [Entomospira nematocerorum]|uniref:Flagellar biosynthetic protein FliR n=1 Tax=Entomospira nematocerorum TaxID=2719987 RepID=A0A968KSW1_9SPIO|nr:flagellar biosynthetic protein FliR [Entomospira nematocera]NIZ47010.1 flagellar biosynthetic protein FliR [Entomospira nematocera]WDI34445.1 flagellar biosynthetic protein FliR [Entomospira nematocera]
MTPTYLILLFLAFARIFAMLQITPLISIQGIPYSARAGLALLTATIVVPTLYSNGYVLPQSFFDFIYLLFLEITIGLIIGFYLVIIFMLFELMAQMFSMQMGFAAAEMFDPLTNSESPLLGQFLNLAAFFIFMQTFGLHKLFLIGVEGSFLHLNATTLLFSAEPLAQTMIKTLSTTFGQALLMALPIIGILFMLSITMGLMAKAAPQMNLLMVGFPIQIMLGLFILMMTVPALFHFFSNILEQTWISLGQLILQMRAPK